MWMESEAVCTHLHFPKNPQALPVTDVSGGGHGGT